LPPPPSFGPRLYYEAPPARALEDRLAHLLDWATDVSGADVAFVADREGLLLARRRATDVEEAVAAVLEGFLEQLGPFLGEAVEGHVTLRSHGRVFVVTWHETDVGRFFLGIVGAVAPPPSVVPELASALASTVADVGELARTDIPQPRHPTPRPRHPTPMPRHPTPPPMPRDAKPPDAKPLPMPRSPAAMPRHPTPPPMPSVASAPEVPVVAAAPPMGRPAPLVEAGVEVEPVRFEPPPLPMAEAQPPDPTPPPEVAPSRGRRLLDAIEAAFDPRIVRLRISLQTGLSTDALTTPDALTEAELDAVDTALRRIVGEDAIA
jgi:hypothetical protein